MSAWRSGYNNLSSTLTALLIRDFQIKKYPIVFTAGGRGKENRFDGEFWQRQQRLMQPAFHRAIGYIAPKAIAFCLMRR
jgi:hypothetical protein